MNGRLARNIRKTVNKQVRQDINDVFKNIAEENVFRRIGYAIKIIFKYKLGEPLKIK